MNTVKVVVSSVANLAHIQKIVGSNPVLSNIQQSIDAKAMPDWLYKPGAGVV